MLSVKHRCVLLDIKCHKQKKVRELKVFRSWSGKAVRPLDSAGHISLTSPETDVANWLELPSKIKK